MHAKISLRQRWSAFTHTRAFWWMLAAGVIVLAAFLRLFNLHWPESLVFDEVYYVRDAISQLRYGYPTEWPDDLEYEFGAAELARMGADASYAVHPPLGKWLIGLGVLLFGAENPFGWRVAAAVVGTLSVALVMLLAWLTTRSAALSMTAGFLLAIEGVSLVLSRVGLLDGFLTFFALLGVVFIVLDRQWMHARLTPESPAALWWRPWLLLAALSFGAATSVKWSGLYFVAVFGVALIVQDALLRRRVGRAHWLREALLLQTPGTLVLTLPVIAVTYLASWSGWLFTSDGYNRQWAASFADAEPSWLPDALASLINYHADMFDWHSTLQAPHPYQAHPLTWPFAIRPTSMFFESEAGSAWAISPIPNVLIWWGGVAASVWLVIALLRAWRRGRGSLHDSPLRVAAVFSLLGLAAGYLPWLLTFSRTAVFQFYTVVFAPYLVLALAIALAAIWRSGNKAVVWVFLVASALVSVYFVPLWWGVETTFAFWNLHMWMPSWR